MTTTVDVHCHTFNGADVPVEGFVKHVALRDKRWPDWVKARLARRADKLVQDEELGYEPERTVLQRLLNEPHPSLAAAEGEVAAEAAFDAQVAQDLQALIAEDPATAAYFGIQTGVEGLAFGLSDARAFVEFARNLSSPRLDIARRLVKTYPAVKVFTPMLVDMSYGVDDKPLTSVAEQIDLHEKISRLSILGRLTGRDALLLPFVGFDPRREADSPGALELVRDAVRENGYAGVKLYPPMGFSPIHNEEPGVDAVLTALYDWCEEERVPVTVHCNRSQGAKTKRNDACSDPRLWREVLEQHPVLHLNLGHFGGIRRVAGQSFWPEEISSLATYDHVYADLGCHTDLLEARGRTKYRSMLDKLLAGAGGPMRDRLMYGSDWSMLLQHPGSEGYVDDVSSIFPKEEHERLLGGRARDFLGLGATPNKNGIRILDRMRSLGADPSTWFGGADLTSVDAP